MYSKLSSGTILLDVKEINKMSRKTKKKTNPKLLAIQKVKKALKEVVVTEVVKQLDWPRSNLYFHLDESKADKVSLPHLKIISDAIAIVKKNQQEAEEKLLAQLIKQS